jgi:hypothetical protein
MFINLRLNTIDYFCNLINKQEFRVREVKEMARGIIIFGEEIRINLLPLWILVKKKVCMNFRKIMMGFSRR